MSAELNRTLATGIWQWCRDAGVRHIILCAGARNAPLVVPLLKGSSFAKIWNHFDERGASFFALGLAKASNQPVAVVTTSGTAVAECLPAVIEARYSAIPLVIVSADRPRRFRGSGAPQAIEQRKIFGDMVEAAFDIDNVAGIERLRGLRWTTHGPLHFNVCFDEPLTDGEETLDLPEPTALPALERGGGVAWGLPEFLSACVMEGNAVLMLGEIGAADRPMVQRLAKDMGIPVFAEAQSGLRESDELSSQLIRGGDKALKAMSISFVLRIGGVPSCRFWRDLEDLPDIEVFSITPTGFSGLAREARVWETDLDALEQLKIPEGKMPSLPEVEDRYADFPQSEPALFRQLSEVIPSEASIFLGNSLPIREWNVAAIGDRPHPNVYASRGANGIDGQISTFFGIAHATDTESWGIFGDLTSLYDLNALWILNQLDADLPIRIVVINNAGGRIFSRIPVFKDLGDQSQSIIENHHRMNFEKWAAIWELDYVRWTEVPEMGTLPLRVIIEIVPDEKQTAAFYESGS